MTSLRAAVFLDRDGTLIEDRHYLRDPAGVTLLDGVPAALARLRAAGYLLVVITNQSGIARGLITSEQYAAVRDRLDQILADAGTPLDATYVCPHHPDMAGPCDCRKPGPGMFRQAARDLHIDLARSVLIGDRWRDIEATTALASGARGILVPSHDTPPQDVRQARERMAIAQTLGAAADQILGLTARAAER
jgi:D-glycero-D-manno-heptose 1,7-bisphosphate phosphatase